MAETSNPSEPCGDPQHPNSLTTNYCNRDAGHSGDHGYAGVFWRNVRASVSIYPPGSFPITCQVVVSPDGFFAAPIGTSPGNPDAYRRFRSLEELADMVGVQVKP